MLKEKEIVQIESVAYRKLMLHCLRYPSSKVYGKTFIIM